ncbi:IclR family transcriptional regulator [Runella slithyformis]|uniref:Transcriptional regulator, IclR family n=1 Tax=Runella slithyformis (strain ATCC 29530 / DSM 19594 / LMG 11500 / NCIMB 11436 / LSU 4) TaxID=761193 RepID=A0A7U3ZRF4_RUNSL|nr:IclR family transcriptional regulator C-terminal domain-containing protein [Runella slithyformis]AEI51982.1 transcriptional regulator, IclR family [Runella slithyformis DSM 19594]
MIQVINRALDILEIIAVDPEKPTSLGEIADALGLNHGTCANIMKTLVSRSYLEQVGTKKGYILGAKSYALTNNDAYRKDLVEAAKSEMEKLTEVTNENCLLAILKGEKRIVIHSTNAEQELQVRTSSEKHVYDSASGRMLLAMLSEPDIDRFIAKYGIPKTESWKEADTVENLKKLLSQFRKEECSLQMLAGRQVIGLAVPIQKESKAVASLSIYLPEYRYMLTDKTGLVHQLKMAAKRISQRLK